MYYFNLSRAQAQRRKEKEKNKRQKKAAEAKEAERVEQQRKVEEHEEAERRRYEEEEEEEEEERESQRLQAHEQARATAPAAACGTPPVAADEVDAYEAALARRRAELEQDWKEQMSQEDEQLKAAQAASLAEAAEVAAAEAAAAASAEMEAEAAAPSPAEAGAEESVPASAEAVAEELVPATAPAAAVTPTEAAGGDPNPSKQAQATNALLALLDIGCAEASRRGDENPPKDAKDTLPDAGANSGTDTDGHDVPAPASARAKPQMCEAPTCGLAKDADSAGLVSNDETEHAAATAAAHESMAEEQFQRELQEALEASMTEQ